MQRDETVWYLSYHSEFIRSNTLLFLSDGVEWYRYYTKTTKKNSEFHLQCYYASSKDIHVNGKPLGCLNISAFLFC